MFKSVKEAIIEETNKGSIFAIFLKFSKRSQPNHKGFLDRKSFESLLSALGYPTECI